MRPPTNKEKLVCPKNGDILTPVEVYEVFHKGEGKLLRGIVPRHHHGASKFGAKDGELCEWSGVPVVMERPKEEKK